MPARACFVLLLCVPAGVPLLAQKPDVGSRVRFELVGAAGARGEIVSGRVERWTTDSLVVREPGHHGAILALPRSQVDWMEVAHPVPAGRRALTGLGAGAVLGLAMVLIAEGEPDEETVLSNVLKALFENNPLIVEPQRVSDRMGLGVVGRIIAPAVPLGVLGSLAALVSRWDRWERIFDKSVEFGVAPLPGGRLGLGVGLSF